MNGPFHLYDASTGHFTGQTFHTNDADPLAAAAFAASNTPEGHAMYEGAVVDHQAQRIETGELVDYQPPQPSQDHQWDDATRRWQLSPGAAAKVAGRAAAVARIAALVDSQHEHVRGAVLGDVAALEKLRAIHAEILSLGEQ
jgi:hypothetical protein